MKGFDKKLKAKIALLRIRSGDTEAFGFFYDIFARDIYRFIFFRTSSKEAAEDMTHEVFLQTWQYIVDKKEIHLPKGYLFIE